MKTLYILCFAIFGLTNADYCYKQIHSLCDSENDGESNLGTELQNCNANFSGAHHVMQDLQEYVMQHLSHSFQYLLMSTNFGDYEKNRQGFSKLYRKLSDKTWDDAIDLIKYITKRGGTMQLDTPVPRDPNPTFAYNYKMYEVESLSRALDMHKSLAERGHKIHSEVTKKNVAFHDAETLSYLEEKFVHKHADIIRDLAGHTNDLKNMLLKDTHQSSLAVYLFDEYLQKTV